ncbi:MAG: PilX N-terminal domain-containing pilus assembly protein [Candidatus Eisenbacteria bacterium]
MITTTKQPAGRPARTGEEGMALILALLVLLVLTVIGAALMASVNTETKISGYQLRDTQAMSIAEAGVQEAMLRIKRGDVPNDSNPRRVTMIFNQVAGSLPSVGTDTTALATLQPSGAYLAYSTATKNALSTLRVQYKTRGGAILKYDDAANPKINTATGNPIWTITATGTKGSAMRQVYAEVTQSKFNVMVKGAVATNVAIQFTGNIQVCGHDHLMSTPPQTGPNTCHTSYHAPNPHTTCLPGAWGSSTVSQNGSSNLFGDPVPSVQNQTGFYSGPWDAVGMSQADFWAWVGAPQSGTPNPPNGIYYLDNNNIKQDATGSWHWTGGNGEGFLYIDGDFKGNGGFTFKGLVYCEGDFDVNGNCWILGGLIAKGKTTIKSNGSAIILYSSDTIKQMLGKYGGNMRTIAWREL